MPLISSWRLRLQNNKNRMLLAKNPLPFATYVQNQGEKLTGPPDILKIG